MCFIIIITKRTCVLNGDSHLYQNSLINDDWTAFRTRAMVQSTFWIKSPTPEKFSLGMRTSCLDRVLQSIIIHWALIRLPIHKINQKQIHNRCSIYIGLSYTLLNISSFHFSIYLLYICVLCLFLSWLWIFCLFIICARIVCFILFES